MGYASFVLVLALATPLLSAAVPTLPKYITTCKQNDPNLDECFMKSAKATFPHIMNGDSMLKIPRIDPFRIDELKIGQGGQSSLGLDLSFTKIDLIGLANTDIKRARFDLEENSLDFEMLIPKLTVLGPYEVSGKILVLPITGKGQSNITLENVHLTWTISGKLIGKNPETQRLQMKDVIVDINPENMRISMEGLFGGEKILGNQMNIFLNENWREVLGELKGGLNEAMAQIVLLIGNQIISSVPFVQLLPPK